MASSCFSMPWICQWVLLTYRCHHVSQCHFAMNHQEPSKYNASVGQTSQSLGLNDELDEPQSPTSRGGESRGAESIGLRSEATSFSSRRGAAEGCGDPQQIAKTLHEIEKKSTKIQVFSSPNWFALIHLVSSKLTDFTCMHVIYFVCWLKLLVFVSFIYSFTS